MCETDCVHGGSFLSLVFPPTGYYTCSPFRGIQEALRVVYVLSLVHYHWSRTTWMHDTDVLSNDATIKSIPAGRIVTGSIHGIQPKPFWTQTHFTKEPPSGQNTDPGCGVVNITKFLRGQIIDWERFLLGRGSLHVVADIRIGNCSQKSLWRERVQLLWEDNVLPTLRAQISLLARRARTKAAVQYEFCLVKKTPTNKLLLTFWTMDHSTFP